MEWKEIEAQKQVGMFLERWGRGKRNVPVKKIDRVGEIKAKWQAKAVGTGLKSGEILFFHVASSFVPKVADAGKPLVNGWSYGAWLKKRGYEVLGHGAYSYVYGKKGSDRVIKITAGSQDDWIDYIQWAAKEGYCGTFAPRVYSWKKYTGDSTFSVSVVERMDCTLNDKQAGDYRLIETLMYPAIHSKILIAQVYMEDLIPGSVDFFTKLIASFTTRDIYSKNMMVRKDGTFCVTDPVCGQCKTTVNRLRSKDFTSLSPAIEVLFESCY